MQAMAFSFLDAPRLFPLIDHELELVEPDLSHVDELMAACRHPLTKELMPVQARTQRDTVLTFLAQNPHGQSPGDAGRNLAPGYTFWMRVRPDGIRQSNGVPAGTLPEIVIAGAISLRIGHSVNLDRYLGHIGYHVLPAARGRHFSERATRLLLPLARAHGHHVLWITCNPDNVASRRTCERLGAVFVDIVSVPLDNPLYAQGDRQKCRYRLDL
jgi:RimJ/RimL family protein N-acetyltransferase